MNKHWFAEACHSIMVGSHIKSLRHQYNIKQKDLAYILDLKIPAISKIERGHQPLTLFQAKIINEFFTELQKKDRPHDPIAF